MSEIMVASPAFEFPNPVNTTVVTYLKGLWTDRISIEELDGGWRGEGCKRDPWSFKRSSVPPLWVSFRANGNLEVALDDASKIVWERPTKLICITRIGQRITHTSRFAILRFSPELLAVNRVVLKAHLADSPTETFSLSALEDGDLVVYTFVRAEKRIAKKVGAPAEDVWRWGGSKASPPSLNPSMYAQANLVVTTPFDLFLDAQGELVGWTSPTQDTVTVLEGYEPFTSVALWQEEGVSQPRFATVILTEEQSVRMSDAVRLATTILVPGDEEGKPLPGPFPTVLMRTPYGRNGPLAIEDSFAFVSRGYVVVSQDVRGRGDSEGIFQPLYDDISDGNDTLNWIAAQPWSDGSVGMFGASYLGWVQWQAAANRNTHLKALVSIVPTSVPYGDMVYVNGLFSTGSLAWSIWVGTSAERMAEAMKKDLNAIASEFPLIDADIRAVGHEIPFWRSWVSHSYLDEYWQRGNILNHQEKIDLPVLHVGGWFDDVLRGTMFAYDMMKTNRRANQQLLLGPWPHSRNCVRRLAELPFGPDSTREDLHYEYVRWFDRWLKGMDNKIETDPAVRYFTMGENKWHTAETWPPADCIKQKWYLHSSGSAASSDADGRLSATVPPEVQAPDHYAHDPANPVPYLADLRANQLSVPEDYQEVERRSDTLVYSTETFEEPFEITGESMAVIHAATDRRDTDWVVRITDVFPDGRSINVIDGYLRSRFRNGLVEEELLQPGEIVRYQIPMLWTSYRFAEGHRLRLVIASAAAGVFLVNTNSGNPIARDSETHIAHQSVYHTERYPSHIEVSARRTG